MSSHGHHPHTKGFESKYPKHISIRGRAIKKKQKNQRISQATASKPKGSEGP